jgi:tetratricopeptide (TPR) repeat protein
VIRAYAYDQLEERDRIRAYNAVGDHFAALPPENVDDATELAHVKNSLEIFRALMGASRIEEAFQLYRGELADSLLFSIGANHAVIELLAPLVGTGPQGTPILADAFSRSYAMTSLSVALHGIGHFRESAALDGDTIRLALDQLKYQPGLLESNLSNLCATTLSLNLVACAHGISELAYDLAWALDDKIRVALESFRRMQIAISIGRFEEADAFLAAFRLSDQPPRETYRPGGAEYEQAVLRFFQGRLTAEDLDDAEEVATSGHSIEWLRTLASLRGEWELTRGNPSVALDAIERALSIAHRTGAPLAAELGMRALALARLGQTSEAREALAEADDAQGERSLRCPLFAAETWLIIGDRERASELIRRAYRIAWADGPPFVRWYDLKRCRELMADLGEPEPVLPPFDPAKVEPIPFEAEIRSAIDQVKAERARDKDAATEEGSATPDPNPS